MLGQSLTVVDVPYFVGGLRSSSETLALRLVALTLLVLTANLASVLLITWADGSVLRSAEVVASLDLPCLGSVPRSRRRWRPTRRRR